MYIQNLNDGWKFAPSPKHGDAATLDDMPGADAEWRSISVPGDVTHELFLQGVTPDYRYDTDAQKSYFVTANEWWYKLEFDLDRTPNEKDDLIFEGLDGTADIWLNGKLLGHAKNAHHPYIFMVRGKLFTHGNVIVIRFRSIDEMLKSSRYSGQTGWGRRRSFLRKPQYTFGWDWAIPLPSLGIWKSVRLEIDNNFKIADCSVEAHLDGNVYFQTEVAQETLEKEFELHLSVEGHGFSATKILRGAKLQNSAYFKVADPKLWAPVGYGDPNLYSWKLELYVDGVKEDEDSGKFGFREVKIIEEPWTEEAGDGYSFWLSVNGMRTFCKGGNWIPLELFPALSQDDKYEFAVKKAHDAGFTMLRVWGGGVYENDIFYDLCDKYGIMVWQDFMFASTGYPLHRLHDTIINEATYQITRLRSHPCLTLWCGCNEDCYSWVDRSSTLVSGQNDDSADTVGTETDDEWLFDRVKLDPQLYTMMLRGLVGKFGLGVPFIESSPQSRVGAGNQPYSGNAHISCWKYALFGTDGHPEKYRGHFEQTCSFDSEFCLQGPSSEKMIRSFMRDSNQWPPNEAWNYHVQRGHYSLPHHVQTCRIAGGVFGEIDSLQKYVKYGQAMHLEMMRDEFESARYDYPNNGGAMMWMYLDCWPTSNWAIIDYNRDPKPAYYSAKRACAPVLPIVFHRGGKLHFAVSNHSAREYKITVKYGISDLTGNERKTREAHFTLKPFETHRFSHKDDSTMKCRKDEFVFIDAVCDDKSLERRSYFPNMWKDVPFEKSELAFKVASSGKTEDGYYADLTLVSPKYARLVNLRSSDDVWFEDNFFDLLPNAEHTVRVTSDKPVDTKNIKVCDWFDDWE